MKFEFDLESAERELECINNLLCTYQEFFNDECPEENDRVDDVKLAALLFASRVRQYHSLIDAAQDKIIAMRKEITAAIEKHYGESKKKGGEAV